MGEVNPISSMFEELGKAGLSCYGMQQEGRTILLFYEDERIDSELLNPIFERYRSQVTIFRKTGFGVENLKTHGVDLQSLRNIDLIEKFGYDVIEIVADE